MSGTSIHLYVAAIIVAVGAASHTCKAVDALREGRLWAGVFWALGAGCAVPVALTVWSVA